MSLREGKWLAKVMQEGGALRSLTLGLQNHLSLALSLSLSLSLHPSLPPSFTLFLSVPLLLPLLFLTFSLCRA